MLANSDTNVDSVQQHTRPRIKLGGITARLEFAGVQLSVREIQRVLPTSSQTQNSPTCSPPDCQTTPFGSNPRDRILGLESCTTSGVTSSQETRPAQPRTPLGLPHSSVVPATMVTDSPRHAAESVGGDVSQVSSPTAESVTLAPEQSSLCREHALPVFLPWQLRRGHAGFPK